MKCLFYSTNSGHDLSDRDAAESIAWLKRVEYTQNKDYLPGHADWGKIRTVLENLSVLHFERERAFDPFI